MKPSIVTVLFVVCAVAAAAQAVPQSSAPSASSATSSPQSSQDANARQARSLLEECIQALGGQAWLNLQEMEQQGRAYAYSHGQPNSLGTLFWRFWKYPYKERIELTKQRDVVFINVGENGYEITYKGTAAMEPDQLADYNRRQERR